MNKIICAVIPAHNEEDTVEFAIMDLIYQSYRLHKIIVVDDFSTDNTSEVVERMVEKYPNVIVFTRTTTHDLRAGAINTGLQYLQENIKDCDFVLCLDADSRFERHLVSQGAKSLESDDTIGGVCSIASVVKPAFTKSDGAIANVEKWILWRFQRLEYGGFDSTRTSTWKNVLILHGLCSMFRFSAITGVGGYQPNHLLEDYKLTLQLKKAGWKTVFNPLMIAGTEPVDTLKRLARQRIRWMRGGIQIILEEGINKYTIEDALNHLLFMILTVIVLITVALQVAQFGWRFHLNTTFLPIALAVTGYLFNLYNLRHVRNLNALDVAIRAAILPELLLAIFYSGLQVYSYALTILKREQSW